MLGQRLGSNDTGLTSRRRPVEIYVCRFIVVTFIVNLKLGTMQ
jgi:hypothetical protein